MENRELVLPADRIEGPPQALDLFVDLRGLWLGRLCRLFPPSKKVLRRDAYQRNFRENSTK
jgi:hypothetical protein